jgi:hypothetical protein
MVTRGQLEASYDEEDIRVISEAAVPGVVTNPDVKTLLTKTGVPNALGNTIGVPRSIEKRIPTIGETYQSYQDTAPDGTEELLDIGFCGPWLLAFHGSSGEVFVVNKDPSIGTHRMSTSLDHFVEFMCLMNSELIHLADALTDDDTDYESLANNIVERVLDAVQQADADGFKGSEDAWRTLVTTVLREME